MNQATQRASALDGIFDEHGAELGQAKARFWLVLVCIVYIAARGLGLGQVPLPAETAIRLLWFCSGCIVYAMIVMLLVRRFPDAGEPRKFVAVLGDFAGLTYILAVGGEPLLLTYTLLVGVIIGNGMRFGVRYLVIAAILAQISLAALYFLSPFWRAEPELLFVCSFTAIALPATSVGLLRRTASARDTALAAMRAKSRFLAQASHDLRQPIHSIGYYLDLLRGANSKAERDRLIARIERALGSVARLFKSLLDISRLDSGAVEVKAEDTALQELLADLLQQHEQSAKWHEVELRFVPTSLNVRADPALLASMVQNLLSNAIKYSRGSRVLLGVRRRRNMAAIEVHDRGIGIEPQHMPHIFDEFYRGHVAGDRDTEGVGLGLAIVDRLARLSGFELQLRSQRGKGTSASIRGIPLSARPVAQRRGAPLLAPQPLAGFRVILIEDDSDVLDATRELLERWGCAVQAHPGLPRKVEDSDLVIADFDLGGGAVGTEAIAAIRRQIGAQLPAILMTGHTDSRIGDDLDAQGIQILAKPVQPAMLRSILSAFRIAGRNQA